MPLKVSMVQKSGIDRDHLVVRRYTPDLALRSPSKMLKGLLQDIYQGRELAWRLFIRDVQAQFRVTYLGYLWAFLPPLFTSFTFIFLHSQGIVNVQGAGKSYAAFALIGTLLWQTFADALQTPLQSIQNAKSMLAKINFPREAILVAGLYGVLFNFFIRFLLVVGVLFIWKIVPDSGLITFPFWVMGLVVMGFAVGMILVPVGGLYGDVLKSIPIVTQFWMLLTPVVYPSRTAGWLGFLCSWNPVAPLVSMARASLTGESLNQCFSGVISAFLGISLCLAGLLAFRIVLPRIIERLGG